jgi:hypothetical protein
MTAPLSDHGVYTRQRLNLITREARIAQRRDDYHQAADVVSMILTRRARLREAMGRLEAAELFARSRPRWSRAANGAQRIRDRIWYVRGMLRENTPTLLAAQDDCNRALNAWLNT